MSNENSFSVAHTNRFNKNWHVLEASFITLIIFLITKTISPADPFMLTGHIPWLYLAPIFCCLFFGLLPGALSLIILMICLVFFEPKYTLNDVILQHYLIGLFLFTCIVGLFSSFWQARIRHVEHLNQYIRQSLENLSRDYYLLRISHERLEHSYLIKPLSLRDAFYSIQQILNQHAGILDQEICQKLLEICSQYSSINQAVFCLVDEKRHELTPMAHLGKPFDITISDPLVARALQLKLSTYLAISSLKDYEASQYLVVIPLKTVTDKINALIIIKDMPFWSLTDDNLTVLSVLAASFDLYWTTAKEITGLKKTFPDCPSDFLHQMQTLTYLKKEHSVDSGLTGLLIPPGFSQANIVYSLEHYKRSLDYIWTIPANNGAKLVISLLPLTSMEGINGYKKRIADWLKTEFGEKINDNGFIFRYQQLNKLSPITQLNTLISELTHAEV